MIYSWGVGIKMSLLLAAPAMGIILLQVLPLRRALNAAFLMAQVQVISKHRASLGASINFDHRLLLLSRFFRSMHEVTLDAPLNFPDNFSGNGL